jgi:hypothetical protein
MHQLVEPEVQTDGEGWAIDTYFNTPSRALTSGWIRPKHGLNMDRKRASSFFI